MRQKKERILVLGMGRSGLAAARLLLAQGARVHVADEAQESCLTGPLKELKEMGVSWTCGGFPDLEEQIADKLIVCPGIARTIPVIIQADRMGIPVWGELELASHFIQQPLIAVTGTNGKTTTASWIHHLLESAGRESILAGNIGTPLSELAGRFGPKSIGVVEVSSYQLETVSDFHPAVAVITNLTPDHLERHRTMEEYRNIKARIFANQEAEDFTILNKDDPQVATLGQRSGAQVLYFSLQEPVEGAYVQNDEIMVHRDGMGHRLLPVKELGIPGTHNVQNALAALCAAWAIGIEPERLVDGLRSFRGVEHRLELLGTIDGVTYFNDSKATNPESVMMALEAMEDPVIVILGGSPKEATYEELAQAIMKQGVRAILMGQTRAELARALKVAGVEQWHEVDSLVQATELARQLARAGDIILLSPACASFDQFRNFEHRGSVFKEIVDGYRKESDKPHSSGATTGSR